MFWYKLCVDGTDKQIVIEICGPLEKIANCMFFSKDSDLTAIMKVVQGHCEKKRDFKSK